MFELRYTAQMSLLGSTGKVLLGIIVVVVGVGAVSLVLWLVLGVGKEILARGAVSNRTALLTGGIIGGLVVPGISEMFELELDVPRIGLAIGGAVVGALLAWLYVLTVREDRND